MRRLATLVLTIVLGVPAIAAAEDRNPGIRASAERLAAEAVQAGRVEVRRSTARVGIGLAVAVAGAAMMLIEPKQPTQPGVVSRDTLVNETAGMLADTDYFVDQIAEVDPAAVAAFCRFQSTCRIYAKGTLDGSIVGAGTALAVATSGGRTVYAGRFQPFEERSPGMKYGGAALAVVGAAIAGFWSTTTVVRDMVVAPTPGGFRVGSKIGF